MVLSLRPEFQKLIDERVRSGKYRDAEAVLTAALASLDQQERIAELGVGKLKTLFPGIKQKIEAGLRQAKAGKLSDGEAFFDELEREQKSRRSSRKTA